MENNAGVPELAAGDALRTHCESHRSSTLLTSTNLRGMYEKGIESNTR